MKSTGFYLIRYDADEGYVFDWAEPRYTTDENGEEVREHLYVNTIFIGENDSISNYVEVPTQMQEIYASR